MRTPTAEHCLTMAAEAERLASIVSYTRDKTRLMQQAENWRTQAQSISEVQQESTETAPSSIVETTLQKLRRLAGELRAKSSVDSAPLWKVLHLRRKAA